VCSARFWERTTLSTAYPRSDREKILLFCFLFDCPPSISPPPISPFPSTLLSVRPSPTPQLLPLLRSRPSSLVSQPWDGTTARHWSANNLVCHDFLVFSLVCCLAAPVALRSHQGQGYPPPACRCDGKKPLSERASYYCRPCHGSFATPKSLCSNVVAVPLRLVLLKVASYGKTGRRPSTPAIVNPISPPDSGGRLVNHSRVFAPGSGLQPKLFGT
jgi:hypothetical protein